MGFSPVPHRRISILGSRFSYLPRAEIVSRTINMACHGRGGYVCVSNVHTTMMGFWNKTYQAIQNGSTFTVPDGVPIVWAMNLLHPKNLARQDRVRGPTLMRDVCSDSIPQGLRHYLYGGSPEALRALRSYLEQEFPGIAIVGAESPPFRPWNKADVKGAVQRMNDAKAQVVWVGLGAPKQERWMADAIQFGPPLMLGVGAAFDLLPGRIPEAPQWMQRCGLEWLYRLTREPGRLWRRYLLHNPTFLALFTFQWLSSLLFRRSYLCESSASEKP